MWYRVFCRSAVEVPAAEFLADLHGQGIRVEGQFRGDDLGWTAAELVADPGTPVHVERYLTATDDLRSDLNTWAAYLETLDYSDHNAPLMERVIQTQQLMTIRKPIGHANEVAMDRLCVAICRILATRADGVYQVDDDGWYSADGELILKEF